MTDPSFDDFDLTSIEKVDGALVGRFDVSVPSVEIHLALALKLDGSETRADLRQKEETLRAMAWQGLRVCLEGNSRFLLPTMRPASDVTAASPAHA